MEYRLILYIFTHMDEYEVCENNGFHLKIFKSFETMCADKVICAKW